MTDEGRAKELVGALETALHKLVKAATKAAGAVTLSTGAEGARGSTDNHGTERRNDGTERWKGGTERQNDGTEWRKDGAERRIDGTERRNDGATGSGAQAESGADEAVALPRRAFVQNFMGHVVDELSSALGRDILEGLSPDVVESFVGPNGRKAAANAGGEPEKKAAGSWGVLTSFANVPVIMTWVRRRFAEAGLSSGAVKRVEAILWDAVSSCFAAQKT